MPGDLDRAIVRIPTLIAVLGLAGSGVALYLAGPAYAVAFLVGAVAAYFNFRLIRRFVIRLLESLAAQPRKPPGAAGYRLFLQLVLFLAGAFVILRFTGFNVVAALYGFLVCPAAAMLEAIYYLLT